MRGSRTRKKTTHHTHTLPTPKPTTCGKYAENQAQFTLSSMATRREIVHSGNHVLHTPNTELTYVYRLMLLLLTPLLWQYGVVKTLIQCRQFA